MSSDLVQKLRDGNTLDIGEAADRIEALEGEVASLTRDYADLAARTQDAEVRAERLRVALEPFARMGTERQPCDPAEGTMRMRVVTVPEIEAARKALEDDKQ